MAFPSKDIDQALRPGAGGESGSDDFNIGGKEGVEGAGRACAGGWRKNGSHRKVAKNAAFQSKDGGAKAKSSLSRQNNPRPF